MDAVSAARPGERWVVRHRLTDGSATDVIGWIEAIEPDTVSVATPRAGLVQLPRADILLARRAPAAAGGPSPLRTTAEELERYALPGWLGLSEPLGEWTLRAAGGFTGRANSCLAVGDPGRPLVAAAARIEEFSSAHRIAPLAQVIVGSHVEAELRRLGWVDASVSTDVLVCRLSEMLGESLPDPDVAVAETLTASWEAAYHRSRPNDADPALVRRILDGSAPRAFGGMVGTDEQFLAIVRGHLSGPWLGLTCLWTDHDHRGQGMATKVMIALGHWGARRGARYVYSQTADTSEGARHTCARLGFTLHHRYRYLAAPTTDR